MSGSDSLVPVLLSAANLGIDLVYNEKQRKQADKHHKAGLDKAEKIHQVRPAGEISR